MKNLLNPVNHSVIGRLDNNRVFEGESRLFGAAGGCHE